MTTVIDPSDRVVQTADRTPSEDNDGLAGTRTFASLGVDPALVKALAAQGITTTFAIQSMTVADALAGRDVCGKAKTGSGKTLAFGVPLLQRTMAARSTEPGRPRALVLVPTRELAVQVSEVLEPAGQGGRAEDRRRLRRRRHRAPDQEAPPRGGRDHRHTRAGSSIWATGASCRWPTSRPWCSTRPTAWPTWDSCPRWSGCSGVSNGSTRPCCSRPPSTERWTGW